MPQNKRAEIDFFKNYTKYDGRDAYYVIDKLKSMGIVLQGYTLDAGSGNGIKSEIFQRYYFMKVRGCDLIYGEDLEERELFKEETFDNILSICFLHHFPDIDVVFDNFMHWLKPKGLLILLEPNGLGVVIRISYFFRRIIEFFNGKNFLLKNKLATPNETMHTHYVYLNQALKKMQLENEIFDFIDEKNNDIRLIINRILWKILPKKYGANTMMLVFRKE